MQLQLPASTPVKKRPLSRFESSVAEVLRLNTRNGGEDGMLWIDLVEDFEDMFKADPRFDSDAFYNACFGEEETGRMAAKT